MSKILLSRQLLAAVFGLVAVSAASAGDLAGSLKSGKAELKSAGALAFGPDGVLFVGDTQNGSVWAIGTGDTTKADAMAAVEIGKLDKKVADQLGVPASDIMINDMAVNPVSGKAYLSVSRGRGPSAIPVILQISGSGMKEIDLSNVPHASVELPALPKAGAATKGQSQRTDAITDLAFFEGKLYVAGLSNEEFSSRLVTLDVPFKPTGQGASVEIYHGAHGKYETKSPIRTFVTYKIAGQPHLLAAYTCTPLVKLPVKDLAPGTHVKGTTVAELGNR
ncbi:MAG: hypothetical protein ACKO85_17165, partial [Isosphaeraceae bacterium]